MRCVVGFLQSLSGDMRVNLRRDQMRVAEQFLHAAQIRARVQQVRRVTVPQLVRRQARIEPAMARYCFKRRDNWTGWSGAAIFVSAKKTGACPDGGCFNVLQ